MNGQAILINKFSPEIPLDSVSQFHKEFLSNQLLFTIQPLIVQRFLEVQATTIAEAITQSLHQLHFSLPDRVAIQRRSEDAAPLPVPSEMRQQIIGGFMGRLTHADLQTALRSRLLELEQSSDPAISSSALLLRYSTAHHMIHNMLPAGRSVQYTTMNGDEIPSLPVTGKATSASALTASTDAKTFGANNDELGRAELLVPYVEAARKFYLPQWVCFDDEGKLLVSMLSEAEADIASMERYVSILHTAISLASYMVADDEYQFKRYGMLGQLVNQGRALAHYQVQEIIHTIQRRAATHDLDRGLSLSLPYFNDQTLQVEKYDFDIIPSGRVMFIPAFVVLAVRSQGAKVAQDTRLSPSTRRQILTELGSLEQTFLR
jgi:hypothetical protein